MLSRLPLRDPGVADLRSPARFLAFIARGQKATLAGGALFGLLWMGAQAAIPAALGAAVGAMVRRDRTSLIGWSAVLLGLGIAQAVAGVLRHRRAVTNFLVSAVRVQQLVARHAAHLGGELARTVGAGEVASFGATDVERIGQAFDITARLTGAVLAYVAVAIGLVVASPEIGALVALGAPVCLGAIAPVMRPLERRQAREREQRAAASSIASDTVVGLRVLRGLGGEAVFAERFRAASQTVRKYTVETAFVQANLDGLQVLLPGLLVVGVTWLGARAVAAGRMSPGALVAYYAYAAFLVLPIRTFVESASKWTGAVVAARHVVALLNQDRSLADGAASDAVGESASLRDGETGLVVDAGRFVGVVATRPGEAAALVDRLGRYLDPEGAGVRVTLGDVDLADLPLDEVRRRILVVDREPVLLAGTLRETLSPRGDGATAGLDIAGALEAASASDIVEALELGLDTEIPERGRTLSGGQRQRLVLAAALRAEPGILVLDEPTSAVDSHTEARIASRLASTRAGQTTVVVTTSPLILEQVDEVVLLDGVVVARGTHAELLGENARYRAVVTREGSDE